MPSYSIPITTPIAPAQASPFRIVNITYDIALASRLLASGGVVAFPTDTYYALGARASDGDAVSHVFDVKGRASSTPVPVLIPDTGCVELFASDFPPIASALAGRFWPGALTIVVPANETVPQVVTGGMDTVGLRVPDNETALALLNMLGSGITGTSANRTGEPPMKFASEVAEAFAENPGLILEGECGGHDAPSTVVDVTAGTPRILRQGAISPSEIEAVVNS